MKLSLSKYYLVVYKMLSKLHLISSLRNHLVFLKKFFKKKIGKKEKRLNGFLGGGTPITNPPPPPLPTLSSIHYLPNMQYHINKNGQNIGLPLKYK